MQGANPEHLLGAGVLVVHVSTIGAADERCWASTERQLNGSSSFIARASFGPGSAVASAPWTTTQGQDDNGPGHLRRDVTMSLPYFNLADGARSTDASLKLEIIIQDKHGHPVSYPGDDEHLELSSSVGVPQLAEARQHGGRVRVAPPKASSVGTLAVATLDVQTALVSTFSRKSTTVKAPTGTRVPFTVAKKKDAAGITFLPGHELPDSIPVSVEFTFIKTTPNGEQRLEPTTHRAGNGDNAVPVVFAVLTTLFDCATVMKRAEIRLYSRCGDTGAVSKLSSGGRGVIAVHESFEWNISVDLRGFFSDAAEMAGSSSHARQGNTLLVVLVDTAATNDKSRERHRKRGSPPEGEGDTLGVLELSHEELVSCGVAGRWCPLRACSSSSTHQGTTHDTLTGRHGHARRSIVGEALVAFAWMQQGPATDALPKAPMNHNSLGKPRKRRRGKVVERSRESEGTSSKSRGEKGINNATNAHDIHPSLSEHRNNTRSSTTTSNLDLTQQEILVYLHVWDALVPLDWPGSACYFTVRICCRGSRVRRVSTNPAHGKGGLGTNNTTADGNVSLSPGTTTCRERRHSRAGSIHVVWDEHLLLSVKGPVEEGTVVELLLRDASVDESSPLAAREGEPFESFAERNSLTGVGTPTSLARSCSSSSFSRLEIPGPAVYRLRLQHPQGLPEGGETTFDSATKGEGLERSERGFDGVEVRMASLVVLRGGANVDHDDCRVEDFLQRKADVASIPTAVKRRLSTVGGGRGYRGLTSNLLSMQGNRQPCRRARLLDLSAASGLFHQFADDVAGGTHTVETAINTGRSSPEKGESMERYQSSSEPMLTDKGLRLVAQQYFPGLTHSAGHVNVLTEASQQSTDGQPLSVLTRHQDSIMNTSGDNISFAGFVSWLRNLPQEDLGTAGLLVSPRTALHNTGVIMHEDAERTRELHATLELALEPTATLVGGWCSIPLRSTTNAAVMNRVRIGWGRGWGGDRDGNENRDGDEIKAETVWRRHTKMLRRDVAVLGKALAEVEQRCSRGNSTTTEVRNDTGTSAVGEGGGDDCDVAAEVADVTKGSEETTYFDSNREADGVPPTATENVAVAATGGPTVAGVPAVAAGQEEESACCCNVALYLGQKAALLASAAEHLKEALRCAGDIIIQTPGHQFVGGANTYAEQQCSRVSNGSNQSKNVHFHHRHYGLLIQHIKQVTSFQAEISAIQRRTAAIIALRRSEETDCDSYVIPCGTEPPRSALALVKRIRRAQNAARRQQPLGSFSPPCDGIVTGEPLRPFSREQGTDNGECGSCLHSSQTLENLNSLTGDDDGDTKEWLGKNRASSTPPGKEPPAVVPGQQGSGAVANLYSRTPASLRAPFDDMLVRSSSLQIFQRRLESIRAGFHEKEVDFPAGLSSLTPEQALETACGDGHNTPELATPAALCCPIDRFVLHVFVHAGTAEEGGSAVFTDVQELVGMGGLDTHATEKSLRTAAARAGVEDVDRWVVAAVLWQATDAVAKTDCPQSPRQGSMETEAATAAVGLEGGTPDMTAATTPKVVLTQATPLWEELRNEAFRSVLGRSSSWRYEERTVPSADVQPSSATGSTPSTPRGQAQRAGVPVLAGETSANEGCIAQHPRQRYAALQSTWGSFDRALVGALVFVGRGNMVPKLSTTTLGGGQTGNVNSDVAGSLKSVEGILLHTFVIAGFADGSGLGVSDIVDAVSTRRKRVLSAAAAAAATTAGSPSCGIIEEGNGALVGSNKNTCRPGGPRGLEGLPESGRRCVNDLSTRETGTADIELRPVRVDGEQETLANDNGAVDGVSMETDMESRLLVGIPVELRELFRTAALAQAIRRKPQQQHQEASQGSTESNEVEAAEREVLRVLDGNRTLETAPFLDGKTALHHAAARGDHFLVRVLLERGCKPHLKDFEGARACDLTRNLKCLCLLGALKKAPEPSAVSQRNSTPGEAVTARASGGAGGCTPEAPRGSGRAMANVDFAVSFLVGNEEVRGTALADTVRFDGLNEASKRERSEEEGEEDEDENEEEEEEKEKRSEIGTTGGAWVKGIARSYDVRNKVLYIDTLDPESHPGTIAVVPVYSNTGNNGTANNEKAVAGSAGIHPADAGQCGGTGTKGAESCHGYARHVLDVKLLSCSSPQAQELFDQLQEFSCAFKTDLVRSSLDIAVHAAANLGAFCRLILDGFVVEIIEEEVATEACREERLAVAAELTATAAIGNVLRAAQRAIMVARRSALGRARCQPNEFSTVTNINAELSKENLHRTRTSNSSLSHVTTNGVGGTSSGQFAAVVDKVVAGRMNFRCTAIVSERRRKARWNASEIAAPGVDAEEAPALAPTVTNRRRHDLQYVAKWIVQNGDCTVVVRGISYLDAVAAEKGKGSGYKPINLEGRDAGIQRVLDHHGVSLSACLHTFDVMQDMEDPKIVLEMLAAGICQLSTRFGGEDIEFSSLRQPEQDALKADVLSHLYHATDHTAGAAPDWDELTVTMQAYGGVTSVGLVRNGSGSKTPDGVGKQNLVVSAPPGAGWCSPKEAAAALASPSAPQDTAVPPPSFSSSSASSSPIEPLPPSAIDLVLTLMRCNPCEVLGSLSPGIGADGRAALIGRVDNSGWAGSTSAVGIVGGKKDGGGLGHRGSKVLLRERHHRDGGGMEISHDDVSNKSDTFRCSLEVAWDKDEGGIFVQRFDMEPNERKPHFTLRAVGIRGFSISQLPITLEDIDEVWDQAGIGEGSASTSEASSVLSHPRGSRSPSASSLPSSQREHTSRSERSVSGSGKVVNRGPAESEASSARSEKSASMSTTENHNVTASAATVAVETTMCSSPNNTKNVESSRGSDSGEIETTVEATASAALTSTHEGGDLSSTVDQSSQGGGGSGDDGLRSTDCVGDDRRTPQEGQGLTGPSAAGEADGANQKHPSATLLPSDNDDDGVILAVAVQRNAAAFDIDDPAPAPLQSESGVEECGHAGLGGTKTKREPISESSPSEITTTDVDEEHTGQQEEEEGEGLVGGGKDEPDAISESEKGGGGDKGKKEIIDEQEPRGGHAGVAVGIAPTIGNGDGVVLGPKTTEQAAGATTNEKNYGTAQNNLLEDTMASLPHQDPELFDSARSRQVEGEPPADGEHAPASFSDPEGPSNTTRETVASDSKGESTEDTSSPSQKVTGTAPDGAVFVGEGTPSAGTTSAVGIATITTRQRGEERSSASMSAAATANASGINDGILDLGGELGPHPAADPGEKSSNDEGTVESGNNGNARTAMLVEGTVGGKQNGNSGVGKSPPEGETRPSPKLVENVVADGDSQAASAITQVIQLAAGASKHDSVGVHGIINDEDDVSLSHSPRMDHRKSPENQEMPERKPDDERRQETNLTTGQSALNSKPDGVDSKAEKGEDEEETVDTASTERPATPVLLEGGLGEKNTDEKNAVDSTESTTRLPPPLWAFPPSFEALVTLSTASEAVECTVEGEIRLQGKTTSTARGDGTVATPRTVVDSANDNESVWRGVYCVYRIAAEEQGGNHSQPPIGDIDLEDDDAQARLEDLLGGEYGLSMEDVLGRFSPHTDLGSDDAVVRSFADSICELRPSLLLQSHDKEGNGGEGGGGGAVYEAVGAALRGNGGSDRGARGGSDGSDWREMQVRISGSSVLEVGIITSSRGVVGREGTIKSNVGDQADGEFGSQRDGPSVKSSDPRSRMASDVVVDCSGVTSPPELRAHLQAGGIPESGVNVLDKAGFFGAGSVVDAAGVLAALAQEARIHDAVSIKPDTAQPSPLIGKEGGVRGWPGINPGRDRSRVLRLLSEGRAQSSTTTDEFTAVVTGSPEDIKLEVSLVEIEDSCSPPVVAGAANMRVSRFRPLDTSSLCPESAGDVVRETSGGSDNHDSKTISPDRLKPEGVSSDAVPTDTELGVGDRIEARFRGKSDWFPGVVRAIHDVQYRDILVGGGGGGGGGDRDAMKSKLPTVAVDYDDGDVEERVPRVRVRLPGQKQPRLLKEGDEVDVKRGKRIALARVVVLPSASPDEGHYDLELLKDGSRRGGDLIENCPRSAIMALHGWPPAHK